MNMSTPLRIDVSAALRRVAEATPTRPFVTFTATRQSLTYGEFNSLVNRFAHVLTDLGVRRGSYVNLMLPNCLEYLVSSYAIKRLGAIEVAVNCEFRGAALQRVLNLAGETVLITTAEFQEVLKPIIAELRPPIAVVIVGDHASLSQLPWHPGTRLESFGEVLANCPDHDPDIPISDLDVATVIFTSGTTGPSKGCMVSHRWAIRGAESIVSALRLSSEDCFYTAYPLFHTRAAVLDVLATILVGGRVVVAPRFSASRFWADMREFDVSVFSIIGTVMQILWKQAASSADRDHRVRISWGGPITVPPHDFERRFGVKVLPGEGVFGMSETGMVAIATQDPETDGKVRPQFEVRIADEHDDSVPKGAVGEILVRPTEPGVMFSGYLAMPEATVAAWRNLWFHTGDLGRIDEHDRLTFVARKRDTIRRGGHNISSLEIEEVLDTHPAIQESAAVGVPSSMGEEDVKVFIVSKPGSQLTVDDVIHYCHGRMAPYMIPQHVSFIDEIPKTQTGKPAKAALTAGHISSRGSAARG